VNAGGVHVGELTEGDRRSDAAGRCPVCAGEAFAVSRPFQGYVEGYETEILQCSGCDVRFSRRLDVPDWLYDRIYAQAELVPGYARYSTYATRVDSDPEPLDLLADAEDPYWHVREHLRSRPSTAGLRVVELGCGAGYLTYALRRAGIECIGVDISAAAIARARTRFGHAEWFQTLEEFTRAEGAADVVVGLEIIEHVPDPTAFLRDALALLAPGGALLITTPDRDACRPGEVWASDSPPVHLFWFGRKALRTMADACGSTVEFAAPRPHTESPSAPINRLRPPILTADGDVTTVTRRSMGPGARVRLSAAARLWRLHRALVRAETQEITPVGLLASQPGATLAAVLRPAGTHA
jgi:SAM-dependent methyltransferase